MLRFLGFLVVLGAAFVGGVYVGQHGTDVAFKKARELGAEVVAKTTSFERSQSLKTALINAKERLVQAKSDLLDKNYGRVSEGLADTTQQLTQAKVAAAEEVRPKLDALMRKISDASDDAKSLKAGALVKLNEATRELDALIGR